MRTPPLIRTASCGPEGVCNRGSTVRVYSYHFLTVRDKFINISLSDTQWVHANATTTIRSRLRVQHDLKDVAFSN